MGDLQPYEKISLVAMREQMVTQLKLNFAHDNLDEIEFEHRLEAAHKATSKSQLLEVISGLPMLEDADSPLSAPVKINRGNIRETDTLLAVLSGTSRKGIWQPARRTTVAAVLGGVDLDLTEAEFPPGVTEISVFTFMGGCDILVPPDLDVEVGGVPILGGIDNNSGGNTGKGDTLLRIKAFVVLGGLDVKVKEKK